MKQSILPLILAISAAHSWAGELIDISLDAKPDERVFIDNQRGNVIIKGWKKNKVSIKGELDDDAEGYEFEQEGNTISFVVDMPRRSSGNNDHGSKLEIYIPFQSRLEAEGVQANYRIENILGSVELSSINGNLTAKEVRKDISMGTINGSIDVSDAIGDIQLSSINGKIHLSDSNGTLEATTINGVIDAQTEAKAVEIETVNGTVKLQLDEVGSLEVQSVSGKVKASLKQLMKNGEISINSVSSPIELALPQNVSAEFRVSNQAGGRITNQLSDDKYKRARFGPGKELRMVLGEGSGEVSINSVSAKVNLVKQ